MAVGEFDLKAVANRLILNGGPFQSKPPRGYLELKTAAEQGEIIQLLTKQRDHFQCAWNASMTARSELAKRLVAAEMKNIALEATQPTELLKRIAELEANEVELRKRLWLPTEPGEHDYIGPTTTDPETGRPVPVPDPVHERFHGAVGDVIAGRIMPAARKQMQEALKRAPKEPITFPTAGSTDDPRRIGWSGHGTEP